MPGGNARMKSKAWQRCVCCFFIGLIGTAGILGCGSERGSTGFVPEVTYFSGSLPRNIAHRGGKGIFPENTLYAFEQALALGVQILEVDVWRTEDGHVVILHDRDVDRTTNGTGAITGKTLEAVQDLDAAYWFDKDQGYPLRDMGITIPTLEEAFQRFPGARFSIEIKQQEPPIEQDVLNLIKDYDMEDKVCLGSFYDDVIQRIISLNDRICLSPGILGIAHFLFTPVPVLEEEKKTAQVLMIPEEEYGIPILTDELIEKARLFDLEIHVWTVNDPEDMVRILDMGVHGIITDFPDRLKKILQAG